jgi:predicted nucleic acid-binding protein
VLAIVDTGPLYAVTDTSDADHQRSLDALQRRDLQLIIPALVVAETTYLIGHRLGAAAEAAFLRSLKDFHVEEPATDDWPVIGDLVDQYADFPLGGADASVIALAARLDTDIVVTLDRRHFSAVRPPHCEALRLIPE